MDLIDMNQYKSQNSQYRYILTVIDYFSRKVFAQKLKNKDVNSVEEALNDIVSKQAFNTYPQLLISDGGTEFNLSEWCKTHKIKHIITESHSPTQNALIENFNGSLRRLIRSDFVRTKKLNWINNLQVYIDNYNSTIHKTTNYKPDDIWSPEKIKVKELPSTDNLNETKEEKISELSKKTLSKIEKQFARLQNQKLNVGDKVRVSTKALNSEVRKAIKSGNSKLVVVKFSAKIFTVDKISKSRAKKEFAIDKYILRDKNNKLLLEEFKVNNPNKVLKPKKFNITELLKIDPSTQNTYTKKDEELLNKIENVEPIEESIEKPPKIKQITTKEKSEIEPIIRKSNRVVKHIDKLNL